MELAEFLCNRINRTGELAVQVLTGLTREELTWRPGPPRSNPIWLYFFHIARFEDQHVNSRIQRIPDIWESQGWYKKLNMPKDDSGYNWTPEQLAALSFPGLEGLLGYEAAARTELVKYFKGKTAKDFETVIDYMGRPQKLGDVVSLAHVVRHLGEMFYLRGLLRSTETPRNFDVTL